MRETQRKGDIAKAQSIASFTRLGYDVGILITESAAYDLLVDDGASIFRVQVKYCGDKNGWLDLRQIHSNARGYVVKKTESKTYDWLYVLGSDGTEYLLKDCLVGRRSISLSNLPVLDRTADAEANRFENDGS